MSVNRRMRQMLLMTLLGWGLLGAICAAAENPKAAPQLRSSKVKAFTVHGDTIKTREIPRTKGFTRKGGITAAAPAASAPPPNSTAEQAAAPAPSTAQPEVQDQHSDLTSSLLRRYDSFVVDTNEEFNTAEVVFDEREPTDFAQRPQSEGGGLGAFEIIASLLVLACLGVHIYLVVSRLYLNR